jgi:hypothetical protein
MIKFYLSKVQILITKSLLLAKPHNRSKPTVETQMKKRAQTINEKPIKENER